MMRRLFNRSFAKGSALGLLAAVALLSACPKPAEGGSAGGHGPSLSFKKAGGTGPVVAKIGDITLTTGDVQNRLNEQSPFVRARYSSPEKKKEFLENQVRFEVLAIEALKRGLANDTEVQDAIKKIVVQKLTRDEFDGRVKLSDVTDAEISTYYSSHLEEYNKPEMMRASVIRFDFGADKNASKAEAAKVQKSAADKKTLEDRNHFKQLVSRFSTDEDSKRTSGDVRYLSATEYEERYGAAVKDAVWALANINDVSDVVEGKDGWYIIKKTGVRKPITRTLDQVKNQIRNLLYREKRTQAFDDFVNSLKTEIGVETFPERMEEVKVETGPLPSDSHTPLGGEGHGH